MEQIASLPVRVAGSWVLHGNDPALTIKMEVKYERDGEVERRGKRQEKAIQSLNDATVQTILSQLETDASTAGKWGCLPSQWQVTSISGLFSQHNRF